MAVAVSSLSSALNHSTRGRSSSSSPLVAASAPQSPEQASRTRRAMGSEVNGGGGADRPAADVEAEKKSGAPPFEVPEVRFTKLFINGCFVDAVSGTYLYLSNNTHLASRLPLCLCGRSSLERVASSVLLYIIQKNKRSSSLQNGDRSSVLQVLCVWKYPTAMPVGYHSPGQPARAVKTSLAS